jgi:hypothetical protein
VFSGIRIVKGKKEEKLMATTVIQNACVAGTLLGLMARRYFGSFTATDYAAVVNTARAIADEFITENTASGAPMADADNSGIGLLVQSVSAAAVFESGTTSIDPTAYVNYAKQIYAASKEGLTKLI